MVDPDRTTDQFIREVDEEIRRDQLKAIWQRYGIAIIAACVLIVLVTGGWRGWVWWTAREAAQDGDAYLTAVTVEADGRTDEAAAAFERLRADGSRSYPALARFQLASVKAKGLDKAGALADFDAIAADGSVEAGLRDVARLRGGLLALDANDPAGAANRVSALAAAGNPFRNAAREILGLSAYAGGDLAKSRQYFVDIQSDAESPQGLRSRAGVMLSLIDGQSAPAQAS